MSLIKDLQFSLRQLRKAKIFAVVAVVTLALGIGCNTAIFSVFYSVLLRPLPFSEPDRLVIVSERATSFPMLSASWLNFKDWKAQNKSFEEFGATRVVTMALTGSGQPEQIPGQMISGSLLQQLEPLRKHPDDSVGLAIKGDGLPDDTLRAAEPALPQPIAQKRDGRRCRLVVHGSDRLPRNRVDSKHVQ